MYQYEQALLKELFIIYNIYVWYNGREQKLKFLKHSQNCKKYKNIRKCTAQRFEQVFDQKSDGMFKNRIELPALKLCI